LQAGTVLQGPVGTTLDLAWRSPGGTEYSAKMVRVLDVSALLKTLGGDALLSDVITSKMLDSGLGYIKITGFASEIGQADSLFASDLQALIDAGAKGIILDVRDNTGGLVSLAMAMAGRFFPDYQRLGDFYYADGTGGFAYRGYVEILASEPFYDGPVAVLVNEMTGSAGDLFTYAMQTDHRALIVGYTPTGGFTGEVADGQYKLPGDLQVQIPTGRLVDHTTGDVLIEGTGVAPDVRVPRTWDSLMSSDDEVLHAAEAALLGQ
jgi:C-terminal processing protease CtpA/Prc